MPQSNTEEIKSRIDIVDLVREYIQLKPAGSYHKANCPFHNEKTPSFMVSPERQMYHCFGCGEHGDIFTFVQKMEGVEFPESLRLLAKKAGVEIKTEDPKLRNERTKLHDILGFTARVYQEYLRAAPADHPVRNYIASRGMTDELIESFQIGFAPDSWDALSKIFAKKNIRPQDAHAAGLLVRKDDGNGFYDRFRARLMFPICDAHGTVVGFGGRVIPTLEAKCLGKDAAKYINSPQSPMYNKSTVLYGMHLAKNSIRQEKKVIVVEGYMDCIAAHKAGTEYVVASSGTAFTDGQAKLIKRFTSNVLISYDMDAAGIAAAARGVDVLLSEGITVRVIELQGGKDPDEVIRTHPEEWKRAIATPKLFLDFAFDQALKEKDLSQVEEKKAVAAQLVPLVASIGNPIEQSHYMQRLAEALHVEESVIRESVAKLDRPVREKKAATKRAPAIPMQHPLIELLSISMRFPDFFQFVSQHLSVEAVRDASMQQLYKILLHQYNQNNKLDFEEVRKELLQSEDVKELVDVLNVAELASARLSEHSDAAGKHLVARLMQEHLRAQLRTISDNITRAERAQNSEELSRLAESFEHITRELKRFTSTF